MMANSNLLSTGLADKGPIVAEPNHLLYQCLQTPMITLLETATQQYDNVHKHSVPSTVYIYDEK